jgi:hypothetical protein
MDPPSCMQDPACRIYRPGLPSTAEVLAQLKSRMSE